MQGWYGDYQTEFITNIPEQTATDKVWDMFGVCTELNPDGTYNLSSRLNELELTVRED